MKPVRAPVEHWANYNAHYAVGVSSHLRFAFACGNYASFARNYTLSVLRLRRLSGSQPLHQSKNDVAFSRQLSIINITDLENISKIEPQKISRFVFDSSNIPKAFGLVDVLTSVSLWQYIEIALEVFFRIRTVFHKSLELDEVELSQTLRIGKRLVNPRFEPYFYFSVHERKISLFQIVHVYAG